MKKSAVKIAMIVWGGGLVLTTLMLSVPPANVPLYVGLACIAVVPLILGSRRHRIFGTVAIAVSLALACLEYQAGLRISAQMQHFHQTLAEQQPTNSSNGLQTTNRSN